MLGVSALLFIGVFAWRLTDDDALETITLLYAVPIALVALEFGTRWGLAAAGLALALVVFWAHGLAHADVTLTGYVTRGVAFVLLAVLPGQLAGRLRRVAEENARFYELSVDMLCTAGPDGYFERLSPSWQRTLGWTAAELRSRPFIDFVHPDDRDLTAAEMRRLAQPNAEVIDFENRYRCSDGSYRTLLWSARTSSAGDLIYATAKDVTERRAAERSIRESERRLRSILDNAPAAIYIKDLEGRYVLANRGLERLVGAPSAELTGKTDHDLLPEPAANASRAGDLEVLRRGEALEVEELLPDDDGEHTYMAVKFPLRDAAGETYAICGIATDITARKRAEALAAEARAEAERANRAKSEFLSHISHELRTPLNAILGFGQLLATDDLSGDQRERVDHINRAGRHLLALIDEMLDIGRIERGGMRLSLEPVSVHEVFTEALGMVGPLAAARNVQLPGAPPAGRGVYVRADRQRLKQVLLNLLANAVKYNRDAGKVRLACEPIGEEWRRLVVADTGIGIAAHDLARLFTPFERLGADQSDGGGTGLGLTLSKGLVEAMGGKIGVRSEVGSGSTFWVQLAAVEAPRARPRQIEPKPLKTRTATAVARTVLYVEDNVSNVKLIEHLLARRPEVTLLVAMQGSLGLDLAFEHRPSLVLLDLHLPDMTGEEVLRRLRADPRTCTTPVVVISADAMPRNVQRLRALGAADYLIKPFDLARFLAVIDGQEESAPPPVSIDPPAATPDGPLDWAALATLRELQTDAGGGSSGMDEVVATFLRYTKGRLVDLGAAIRDYDAPRTEQIAHSLAGSSASFAARRVAALARELEAQATAGDLSDAPALWERLEGAYAEARTALHREFPGIQQRSPR